MFETVVTSKTLKSILLRLQSMNFMLIHFLAKTCWSLSLVIAQIVWYRVRSGACSTREQEALCHLLSASSEKADTMSTTEEQQAVSSHRGLLQRRSFYSVVEESATKETESVAMSRQSSSQSQKSSASVVSDISTQVSMDEKMPTGQPTNFGTVVPGVYRSSYPQEADYPFIQKLGLKTIM